MRWAFSWGIVRPKIKKGIKNELIFIGLAYFAIMYDFVNENGSGLVFEGVQVISLKDLQYTLN
jgi:hypothetical protein